MMGIKERAFGPLPPVSLEDLVPPDHFYRHLERTLDLAFVRDLVRDTYAEIGRPSIDPVVFFKLQLILFFEGLRSERQLHAGGGRPAQPALVPRLRPDRGAARPLQPDPHPRAVRAGGLPPLLRGDRRAVHRGRAWSGARSCTSTRPRSRPTPRSTRSSPGSPSRPTSPGSSPTDGRRRRRRRSDGRGRGAGDDRRRCRSR